MTKARKNLGLVVSGQKVWDIGSTTVGAEATTTLKMPYVKVGDVVAVNPRAGQAGFVYRGYVSASGTVTLVAVNASAATANPASTTFDVMVFRVR